MGSPAARLCAQNPVHAAGEGLAPPGLSVLGGMYPSCAENIFHDSRRKGLDKAAKRVYSIQADGRLAQLVAHPLDVREVTSSSLVSSTKKNSHPLGWLFLFAERGGSNL